MTGPYTLHPRSKHYPRSRHLEKLSGTTLPTPKTDQKGEGSSALSLSTSIPRVKSIQGSLDLELGGRPALNWYHFAF